MKTPKLLAIAGGAVLLVSVAVMLVLLASFDAARLKGELIAAVREQTGRTLRIDGDLSLGFWPNVGVKAGRMTLSERDSAADFATLDSARVAVAVVPLLSQRVVAKTIAVSGLKLTVIKRPDGTRNIDDLLGKPPAKAGKVGAGGTASAGTPRNVGTASAGTPRNLGTATAEITPRVLAIAGISLTDAVLTWRNEQAGRTVTVADLDLDTGGIMLDASRRTASITALTLVAQGGGKADAEGFVLRLDAPHFTLAPEQSGGEAVTLTARLDGAGHTVNATLELVGLALNADALSARALALNVDAHFAATAVKARLAAPLAVDLTKSTFALEQLAGHLVIAHPRLSMKSVKLPITGSLHADLAKSTAALRLDTRLDDSAIALRLDASRLAPLVPMALAFDLVIDQLNVDRYLPARTVKGAVKTASDKLDFAALRGLDLRGTARIGALQAAQVKMQDVRMQVKVADGRLAVAPHSMKLYDGSLVGALILDADGNRVQLKQTLTGVQIQPLLNDLANQDMLAGRGNIALDLTTQGASVGALKKALAGTANLRLKDGAIKGINLAQSLRELKAKLASRQDAVEPFSADRQTDFSELSASFRIAEGVAHNQDMKARSPLLRLAGAGDIDIGNSRIDYRVRTGVVATGSGQGGRGLAHVKGLTIPVRLSGPLDSPAWKIEFSGLAGGATGHSRNSPGRPKSFLPLEGRTERSEGFRGGPLPR